MNILAFDTSTDNCTIALLNDSNLIFELNSNIKIKHSEKLLDSIDYVLKKCGTSLSDIDFIITGKGPGSFTGIRIGISTANSFALSLKKKILGIVTIDSIAHSMINGNFILVPVLDAHRDEIYTAYYESSNGIIERKSDYLLIKPADLSYRSKKKLLIFGPGTDKYYNMLKNVSNSIILKNVCKTISAFQIGLLGYKLITNGYVTEEIIKPLYIRKSDAELKLGNK